MSLISLEKLHSFTNWPHKDLIISFMFTTNLSCVHESFCHRVEWVKVLIEVRLSWKAFWLLTCFSGCGKSLFLTVDAWSTADNLFFRKYSRLFSIVSRSRTSKRNALCHVVLIGICEAGYIPRVQLKLDDYTVSISVLYRRCVDQSLLCNSLAYRALIKQITIFWHALNSYRLSPQDVWDLLALLWQLPTFFHLSVALLLLGSALCCIVFI